MINVSAIISALTEEKRIQYEAQIRDLAMQKVETTIESELRTALTTFTPISIDNLATFVAAVLGPSQKTLDYANMTSKQRYNIHHRYQRLVIAAWDIVVNYCNLRRYPFALLVPSLLLLLQDGFEVKRRGRKYTVIVPDPLIGLILGGSGAVFDHMGIPHDSGIYTKMRVAIQKTLASDAAPRDDIMWSTLFRSVFLDASGFPPPKRALEKIKLYPIYSIRP